MKSWVFFISPYQRHFRTVWERSLTTNRYERSQSTLHTVHIKSTTVYLCPLVGTGTLPPPSLDSECAPPPRPKGKGTLACGWGVGGVPIRTNGESLALCLLCANDSDDWPEYEHWRRWSPRGSRAPCLGCTPGAACLATSWTLCSPTDQLRIRQNFPKKVYFINYYCTFSVNVAGHYEINPWKSLNGAISRILNGIFAQNRDFSRGPRLFLPPKWYEW